jgi:hypothetical protein
MTTKDAFADRKRTQEEEYFRKKEQELIERRRRRTALEGERQDMAQVVGVADKEILREIQECGFTRDTGLLLYLVPIVQIAWAEGKVTNRERKLVFEAARAQGVEEDSLAYQKLSDWLMERPAEEFFDKSLHLIRMVLQTFPREIQQDSKINLFSYCTQVAEASGGTAGFLGGGYRICDEERTAIKRVAAELSRTNEQELLERLQLAEATGINDESVLRELQALGYTCETARLVYFVPLVQVAWAEDNVTRSERKIILAIARFNGIKEGSLAYEKLVEMLDHRPSAECFERTLQMLSAILQGLKPEHRFVDPHDLLTLCTTVAEASNVSVGFNVDEGNVCYEEQRAIEHISEGLKIDIKRWG